MISLFPHQQEALQETKDFDNIAVYHDMGLGKTFTGSEMMKRFGCKVNLIVCQKSKVQDWVEHFTDNYQMQVFDLTNKKQLGEYHGLSQGQRFFIVGVINYELAWRRKELLDLYDFTLMLDESSLIQNQKAKQTKFILKMKPAHVILLSGTPVGGKYENLLNRLSHPGTPGVVLFFLCFLVKGRDLPGKNELVKEVGGWVRAVLVRRDLLGLTQLCSKPCILCLSCSLVSTLRLLCPTLWPRRGELGLWDWLRF